jgi:negative elongation factor B
LILLLRMMSVGMKAWDMIDSQMFREPKFSPNIIVRFLPALMSLLVDDQVRSLNAKLPPDERESALAIIEHSGPPPDAFATYVQDSGVAALLAMYYALNVTRAKDKTALIRTMGIIANAENGRAFDDTFLHSFVALLIPMISEFAHEDFCTAIFDEFFFTNISRENVCRHVLKLVWYVFPKLSESRRETIMKALNQGTVVSVRSSEQLHPISNDNHYKLLVL